MQLAMCTSGKLYCSLMQENTDADMFCLFITKLATKLTADDRNWRSNSILLIDGARYQTCPQSVDHMRAMGFTVCISAPYSYASAPIEYAFAFFKNSNLNADGLKTGKK